VLTAVNMPKPLALIPANQNAAYADKNDQIVIVHQNDLIGRPIETRT
jgi:hypothetical protein